MRPEWGGEAVLQRAVVREGEDRTTENISCEAARRIRSPDGHGGPKCLWVRQLEHLQAKWGSQ
jgi:streptomycin 6-kinase